MRGQPIVLLVIWTVIFLAIPNVAAQLGKPASILALGNGDNNVPTLSTSHNSDEERSVSKTTMAFGASFKRQPMSIMVFKLLKLHEAAQQLFERRRFLLWIYFMKLFHPRNPARAIMVTLNAIPHYNDEMLAKMLLDAKKGSKTRRIATKLQYEQLQIWKREKKSPVQVFLWLQLKAEGQDFATLVEKPEFHTWKKYVNLITLNSKEANIEIVKTLTTFSSDQALAKMLIQSKQQENHLKKWATELQQGQLQLWKSQEISPDDVFVWLNLKNEDAQDLSSLLTHPEFTTWKNYLNLITSDSEEMVKELMIQTLTTHYTDQGLAKMLIASKQRAELKKVAIELQKTQLQSWKKQAKSAADAFVALDLVPTLMNEETRDLSALFKSPAFDTWMDYLKMLTTTPAESKELLIQTLTAFTNDERLAQQLILTKYMYGEKSSVKELAKELQQAQLQYWLKNQVLPKDAQKWMGIIKRKHFGSTEKAEKEEKELWQNYRKDYKALWGKSTP